MRGYLEAEALADKGLKESVQLGLPQVKILDSKLMLDGFTFLDYGTVNVVNPLPGEVTSTTLSSWGAGIDMSGYNHLTGSLVWAYPLKPASHTLRGDSRVLFSIRTNW